MAHRDSLQPSIDDLDFAKYSLDDDQIAALVGTRGECVFNWTTRDGYPMGVVVAYAYRDGRFWTNSSEHKQRVAALEARTRSAVVIKQDACTVTFKGDSVLHRSGDPGWQELTSWFYPALAGVDVTDPSATGLLGFLNSPHQVIVETTAHYAVSFDNSAFGTALQEALAAT